MKKSSKAEYVEKNVADGVSLRVYVPKRSSKQIGASLNVETEIGTLVVYGHLVPYKKGWFFSFPSYKTKDDEYKNLCFFTDKGAGDAISEAAEEAAEEMGLDD